MGKKATVKLPVLKMTYKQMNRHDLANVIEKLKNAETDVFTASRMRAVVRELKPRCIKMEEEYIENIQKPHQAKIKETTGLDVLGEKPETVSPEVEEKLKALDAELTQLQKDFSETVCEFECIPLGPQHFKDIKISAAELEALGPFYDEKGETRTEAFKNKLTSVRGGK